MTRAARARPRAGASLPAAPAAATAGQAQLWAAGAAAAIALLVVLRLASRSLVLGSREGRWVYPYLRGMSADLLLPYLAALALTLGLVWLGLRLVERREWAVVLAWFAGGLAVQLLLRWHTLEPLEALVASNRSNSFYSPTLRYDALTFLREYRSIMETLPLHARTNMPGKVMFFYLLELLSSAPRPLGMLVVVFSNLGGIFSYLVARDLFQDRRAGLLALVFYLVMPGKLYFFPILNTVSPVPILACFWLHVRWLRTGSWGYAVPLGVGLYLLLFFEPLPLVMGLAFLAFLAGALWQRRRTWLDAAKLVAVTVAAFAAAHLAMLLLFRYDIFANFLHMLRDAQDFNQRGRRPYDIWVVQNLFDFVFSAGVAPVVLFAIAAVEALRGGGRPLRERVLAPAALMALSVLAVVAFLDLVGINRGEVTRLWIFLGCFLQALPAWWCARRGFAATALVLAATLLQASVGASTVGFVQS